MEKKMGYIGANPKNRKRRGKKYKKWIIIGTVVAAFVIGGVIIYQTNSKNAMSRAVNRVSDVQVTRSDIVSTISGTATIKPKDQYSITSLVSGDIIYAGFEEGDYVNKDDVLFKIDSRNVEKSIQSADLNLQKARNDYNDTIKTKTDLNVASDVSGIIKTMYVKEGDSVQTGGKIADIYDDTYMELELPFNESDIANIGVGDSATITVSGSNDVLSGVVSSINNASYSKPGNMLVQNVKIKVQNPGVLSTNDAAVAMIGNIACNDSGNFKYITEKTITAKTSGEVENINIKEGNRVSAGESILKLSSSNLNSNIESSEIAVKEANINREKAMEQLEDYTITTPISGTVVTKNAKIGDKIDNANSQKELAVIYDMSSLKFDINIDELDINKVVVGQEVSITADALNGKKYTGYIDKISINGTTSNGVTSYPVTVVIEDFDENLVPGMNVDAEIVVNKVENVLSIPKGAVNRGNIVYVKGEKEDKNDNAPEGYKSVVIETGLNDGTNIEVVAGLSESDFVKVNISDQFQQGAMPMMGMEMSEGAPGGMGHGGPGGPN